MLAAPRHLPFVAMVLAMRGSIHRLGVGCVVGGGERVHPLDHALEMLPPLASLSGALPYFGTRKNYPQNLYHCRSEALSWPPASSGG
jgi:hypothetical protein